MSISPLRFPSLRCAVLLLALHALGCDGFGGRAPGDPSSSDGGTIDGGATDGGPADGGGDGSGQACQRNADCPTGLCLPTDGGAGICTRSCTTESNCVPGWACELVAGETARVCRCSATAEVCDGRDNDCNGVVDDPSVTNTECVNDLGPRAICALGVCTREGCTSDADCLVGSHCDLGSLQCTTAGSPSIRICLVIPSTGEVDSSTCFPEASSPPVVSFGDIAVGRATVQTVRVFNDGPGPLHLTDAHVEADTADFSMVGGTTVSPTLNAGTSTDIQLQFKPTRTGEQTANLVVPSNDAAHASIAVPIRGSGQGPQLCITPNPIDFGTVPKGSSRTQQLTLTNCGNADYDITQLSLVNDDPSNPVFTTSASIPILPIAFPAGASITLDVTYRPISIQTPPNPGDSGYFSIKTDYQRVTVPVTGRGGFPGCDSNGMNLSPSGVIVVKDGARVVNPATETFEPLTTVTLDGSSSTAPAPGRITQYMWRMISQPSGSVARIVGSGSRVTVSGAIVGDYSVELVVGSGDMCQSTPVTVTLRVVSRAAIYVQLTWPQAYGDVDLHYVGPNGTFYQNTSPNLSDLDWTHSLATAYGAASPTSTGRVITDYWGLNNTCQPNGTTSDDATFDVDQRSGYGPENVTHSRPFDGVYKVDIHYYCNGAGTTVSPNVSIFVNGALAWHGGQSGMTTNQVWEAAQIVVANNGTSITVVPLSTPLWRDTHGCGG